MPRSLSKKPKSTLSSLPAVLRRLRKASGLTHRQVAEKCGVFTGTVINIEKGQKVPSWTLLCRILDAMDKRQFLFLAIVLRLQLQEDPGIFGYSSELKAFTIFHRLRRLIDAGDLESGSWLIWRERLPQHVEDFGYSVGIGDTKALFAYDLCMKRVDAQAEETRLVATTFVNDLERWAVSVLAGSEIDFDALLKKN